jgi:hypothetical protein
VKPGAVNEETAMMRQESVALMAVLKIQAQF